MRVNRQRLRRDNKKKWHTIVLELHCADRCSWRRRHIMTTFAPMGKATQYELRLAERMSRLGTETAFEVFNKARALERQGRDVIHLEIGEPDFDTPKDIIEAGAEAMKNGWTHYGPAAGLPGVAQPM